MKKALKLLGLLSMSLILCGCSFASVSDNGNSDDTSGTGDGSTDDDTDYGDVDDGDVDDSDFSGDEATGTFSITTSDGSYSQNGNIYSINTVGTYVLSGSLTGQIYVNVAESETAVENEVELDLNGVSISYGENSPIYSPDGDELEIKSVNGTYNTITDTRSVKTTDDDTQGAGAIYAKCDLHLTGKGTLVVASSYNNGISTTKDLKIKNTSLKVTAVNNALKGNDSIEIESGTILAVSTAGDGLKTENTDISSSTSKQRGNIDIYGGSTTIYAAYDAIDAAYDVNIYNSLDDDSNTTIPVINAYTGSYSTYTDSSSGSGSAGTTSYISVRNGSNSSYRYATYWYNSSDTSSYKWIDCSYSKSYSRGGSGTYYVYSFSRPSDYDSFYVYKFASSVTSDSASGATASSSSGATWNANYDTYIVSVSGSTISPYQSSGSSCWGNLSSLANAGGGPGGGGDSGNPNSSTDSCKGIKADNTITISGGVMNIKAYDDAVHANYGTTLENGSTGLGDVVISGGSLTLYSADDGVHADRYLTISGGNIAVSNCYEGIEANVVKFNGGTTTVNSSDDGVNAANKAGLSPQVIVNGGVVDITIASGDTDGIDSNGNYTQTGGAVITRGSPGSNNRMSTGLDCDGTASISGGTLLCFGEPEATLNNSGDITTKTINSTFGVGTYLIGGINVTTINTGSYSGAYIYSDQASNVTITLQ